MAMPLMISGFFGVCGYVIGALAAFEPTGQALCALFGAVFGLVCLIGQ